MNKDKTSNQNRGGKKTIFFVWNYLQWGGAQIYFIGLMRNVSRKFNVKAILPKGSDKKILQYLEANQIDYEFYDGAMDSGKADTMRRRIQRRANDFFANLSLAKHLSHYDLKNSIVQIDVAPWAGFALLFYLISKTNTFVTFHTAIPELSAARKRLWKTKFSLLTASSRFRISASNLDVKKSLRPFVSNTRYQEIEVIYSSINAEEVKNVLNKNITRREISEKYNFPEDKIWICNVAQFIERKGCWTFLEAIEILQKRRTDIFFFWVGTSPLKKEIIEKIEKYELKDNFRFLSADEVGEQRSDLLALWKAADIFVLPSFQEGLPVALLEAMALGLACIGSKINAIPEALKNRETGLLVEAGDTVALAQTISELADDELMRITLGEKAQNFVLENFEEKVISEKMCRLYEEII